MRTIITFDVGGTSTRAGLYNGDTRSLVSRLCLSTPNFLDSPLRGPALLLEVVRTMKEAMLKLLEGAQGARPCLVVAGMPGPVDDGGRLLQAPTILGEELSQAYPFRAALESALGLPAMVMNDITAAGFRYVGEGCRDFCLVSMGSGVGAKIFKDGQPVLGPSFDAGELGHVVCNAGPDALPCDCGGWGHIGAYASGRGVARVVRARSVEDAAGFATSSLRHDGTSTAAIVKAFHQEDPWTTGCIETSLRPLALSMATIRAMAGIEHYIVIGGFATALGPRCASLLAAQCDLHFAWSGWRSAVRMGQADDDNGLLGGGRYGEERSLACL